MNINKAIIVGRLTNQPELKKMTTGTSVVNLGVATNYSYKDKDGNKQEESEFHNVVAYGKQAETIAQYFVKGQEIYVEGRLRTRKWEDKNGSKHYTTEIILEKFDFGVKPQGATAPTQPAQQEPDYDEDINPEDIPF